MEVKLSSRAYDVLSYSSNEAHRLGNDYVGIEHLLLGILRDNECGAISILKQYKINLKKIKYEIEVAIRNDENKSQQNISDHHYVNKQPVNKQLEKVIKYAFLLSKNYKSSVIKTEHLLLSILKEENNIATMILNKEGLKYIHAQRIVEIMNSTGVNDEDKFEKKDKEFDEFDDFKDELSSGDDEDVNPFGGGDSSSKKSADPKSKTPVLDSFGRDLTRMAEEDKLDPIVGRDKELERIAQILSRRKKNNPILIGEPGVGKSAIAEGLALRIVQRKVPRSLFNKRVVTLDLASLVAGTKYRGQFEERMKAVLKEIEKNTDIIMFIDEIHTIVGAGNASGSLDASNMFKPALARGELQCIGATTLDEYRQYIEKDGALERRFQKVLIDPTTEEETEQILHNIKAKYEDHHLVRYDDEAIKACISLTMRYISDRCLPDKAIDALDEAGARIHIKNVHVPADVLDLESQIELTRQNKNTAIKNQKFEDAANFRDAERKLIEELEKAKKRWLEDNQTNRQIVTEENVAEVVAMMTGIPIQRIAKNEGERLLSMEAELEGSVIGQNAAISKVVKAIRRNRAGLKDPNKPIGSFIFLGPTGVGKTYLAKILAQYLFDSTDAMIRIDMSEYIEKFAVSRLVGAPPGYVGYEEGGQLTEKVRRKPYSIVLLDEIEKAHPDVFHILLQVLDDGVLTDSLGRKVDFKNTIIIMTSNIGTRQLKDFGTGVGFQTATRTQSIQKDSTGILENALKKAFAPEFLNRIDDVIIFNSLEREDIHKIIDIELKHLFNRVQKLGFQIEVSLDCKDHLIERGWDPQYGARPLKRAIQKYIEDELAEELIRNKDAEAKLIIVDYNKVDDKVVIKFKKEKKSKTSSVDKE